MCNGWAALGDHDRGAGLEGPEMVSEHQPKMSLKKHMKKMTLTC